MFNMICADIYKMVKSSAVKILFAITAISSVIMAVLGHFIAEGRINASFGGIAFLFSDINVISILGGAMAGIFICGDFENKTIHEAIASGCSRGKVVISKAAVFFCGVALLLLPYAAVTGIAVGLGSNYSTGKASLGFLYLLTEESGVSLNGADMQKLIVIMAALVIVIAAQLSVCIPLAFSLKRPVLVIGIYYAVSILSAQLLGFAKSSEVFDKIYSFTPFGGRYLFMTLETGAWDIGKSIAVSFFFTVLVLGITCGIFRKAEIK
ncbi:ABC transporter permease [Anaerocolumna xylanovorans]|uniref:ABC-2 family transporter protein n=1 Tax=Anaerocolumna xylanovorans DSM 12503 TaxID=1121345 RepID=A0A1M7Y978_9FIRM|nr:ABC transporter permease [Anaerocolumna xylanovorans]SHO49195.1 ABC-2 family transporter protein [Anaerocolumna xylanovorans DSM 12503]